MMEESDKMIKDSSDRLGKAVGELKDLIVSAIPTQAGIVCLCLQPGCGQERPVFGRSRGASKGGGGSRDCQCLTYY